MADQKYGWELPPELVAAAAAEAAKPAPPTAYQQFQEFDKPLLERSSTIKDYLDKLAQPGLEDSPAWARVKGFFAGALPAASKPTTIASALSLGSGTPAALAGGLLGVEGATTAMDPTKSTLERTMGAAGALGGGAQLAAGLMRKVGGGLRTIGDVKDYFAGKLTPPEVPPVKSFPTAPSDPKAAALATKELMRDQKNLAQVTKWSAAKKAEKDAAAAVARLRGEATEPVPPTYTERATTKKAGVTKSASQKFVAPEEDNLEGGDLLYPEAMDAAMGKGPKPPTAGPAEGAPVAPTPPRPKDAPPAGTPTGDIYDAWVKMGRDHKIALKLATKGRVPQRPEFYPPVEPKVEPVPPAGAITPPVEPIPPAGPTPPLEGAGTPPEPLSPKGLPPAPPEPPSAPSELMSPLDETLPWESKLVGAGSTPAAAAKATEAVQGPQPGSVMQDLLGGEPKGLPPAPREVAGGPKVRPMPTVAPDEQTAWFNARQQWMEQHPDYPKLEDYASPTEFAAAAEDYAKVHGGPPPHPATQRIVGQPAPEPVDLKAAKQAAIRKPLVGTPAEVPPTLEEMAAKQRAAGVVPIAQVDPAGDAATPAPAPVVPVAQVDPAVAAARATEDKAASAYRDILARIAAGEQIGEAERGMAGRAAQAARIAREDAEDAAAGLPPRVRGKKAQARVEKSYGPVEGPPPPVPAGSKLGAPQTAKAREAALAKRAAIKAEAEAKAAADVVNNKQTAANLSEDLANLEKMSPEDRASLIQKFLRGESGAVNPEAAIRLGLAAGGGVAGYESDPLGNPIASAAGGAALGAAGPSVIKALMNAKAPGGLGEQAKKAYQFLPNFARANYLFNPHSLLANSIAGPWGGAIMSALEQGLSGEEGGWKALGQLLQPHVFPRQMLRSGKKALDLVRNAEQEQERSGIGHLGNIDPKTLTGMLKIYTATPAVAMVAGDEAARAIETGAGIPEKLARKYTLTSEPQGSLGRGAKRFKNATDVDKNPGVLNQLLLPFANTNSNIVERTMERFPGIGFVARYGDSKADTFRRMAVQQGLGTAVFVGSEQVGENTDPDTAKTLRKYITNSAGPYSGMAAMGFAFGQARRAGKNPYMNAANAAINQQPLPSTQAATEYGNAIAKLLYGDFNFPKDVPRGLKPGFWPDANDVNLQDILDKLRSAKPEE